MRAKAAAWWLPFGVIALTHATTMSAARHAPPAAARFGTPLAAAMVAAFAVALQPAPALAQQGDGTEVQVPSNVFKPAKVPATPERIAALRTPPDVRVTVFAENVGNARMLAVADDGTVYVSRRDEGDVVMLKDANGDGRADGAPVIVAARAGAHGLAIRGRQMWIVTVKEVFVADIRPDGRLGPLRLLVGDLPDAGQHPNRTIAFGPDGMLYVSVGSTCNACNEPNPENATLLRMSPDGTSRTIFASGLRNTIGFGWHPASGELWGMDHGIDFLGDEQQPEELNRIERGKRYGWPHVWGRDGLTPWTNPNGKIEKTQWRAESEPLVLGYSAHAAPMQMLFYQGGSFPRAYDGDAFVAMRGSWNRNPASGYEVVRVRFEGARPVAIEPFVSGFLTDGGKTHFARPVGLAVARDGAMLLSDDANGVVYRIAYTGRDGAATAPRASAPAGPMETQANRGNGVALAYDRLQARGTLRVSSDIRDGAALPPKHSEYHDGVSMPLEWTPVPDAKSYVVIMEDPDSRPYRPFVHWTAWNIPAGTHALPEGLQEQPRLTAPDGVIQGPTTRGSHGWFGPRPPVGDPPHRYHVQVFALDTTLDLPTTADREQLVAAMQGRVLAKGRLVGTYQQKQPPLK